MTNESRSRIIMYTCATAAELPTSRSGIFAYVEDEPEYLRIGISGSWMRFERKED